MFIRPGSFIDIQRTIIHSTFIYYSFTSMAPQDSAYNVPEGEVLRVLQCCYTELGDSRATNTLQPHEVLMLTSDICFYDIAHQIACEIAELDGEPPPTFGKNGLLAFIKPRELVWPNDDITGKDLDEGGKRVRILYALLSELQTSRLIAGKILHRVLDANVAVQVVRDSEKALHAAAQACGVKAGQGVAGSVILGEIAGRSHRDDVSHLLIPTWKNLSADADLLKQVIGVLNKEYGDRRKVLCRRLDVTIQAFQKSPKAEYATAEIGAVIASVMNWRDQALESVVTVYDLLAADPSLLIMDRISSKYKCASHIKSVVIGAVPDRGGVPEGYTMDALAKDVVKANLALKTKDTGKGKGGKVSYATEARMVAGYAADAQEKQKKWIGMEDMNLQGGGGKGKGGGKGGGKSTI